VSSKVRSLHGRLEYDSYNLNEEHGEYFYGRRIPYCTFVLSLFDLPIGSIVKLETIFELHKRYRTYRAFLVPAWQCTYQEMFKLERCGRFRVEIHAKKHLHYVEYRLDSSGTRPIRQQRSKLELHVTENICCGVESLSLPKTVVQQKSLPNGSLWTYSEEEIR
jgi:hypothetical protein